MDTAQLKTVLSFENMLLNGTAESLLPIMQFNAFRAMFPRDMHTPFLRRAYQTLAQASTRARHRLTPELEHYYLQRNMIRSMGGDPDTVPHPSTRPSAQDIEAERRQRLLSLDLRRHPRPSMHRRGDRSVEAQLERDALWMDWNEAKALQQDRAREQRAIAKAQGQQLASLEKAAKKTDLREPTARELRAAVVRARAEARYRKPWFERALDDEALMLKAGIAPPRAARHLQGHVPLHLRTHSPLGD